MVRRTAAMLLASGVLTTGIALAQTAPNPTQRAVSGPQSEVPTFRIVVVGRTTPAVNYRPRRGDTKVDFVGTALLPQAKGSAKVSGEQGYIQVEARFDKLEPATKFGPEYLTYVLWAITPEGRATNLGEIQVDDDDAKVKVTTELQSFGLIVTAEPYFAVTQPSDVVVMENVIRDSTNGSVELIDAKYELLKRGSYLMNQDAANYKRKPIEPGAPADLAQARNAVELARLAGADRFATESYQKAAGLLSTAEEAREAKRGGNAIMMPARQAAQTAEDARIISLKKQEEAFSDEQARLARSREQELLNRTQAEAARRRQAELDAQTANAGLAAAERAKANSDAALSESEAARRAAEAAAATAQNAAAQSQAEKMALRERLRSQLNVILETRETARGLIINLSDVLFDTASSGLKPGAREKLSRVSGILVSHPGLHLEVEGHTDSVGTDEYNQQLSQRRAESVRSYLVEQRIPSNAVGMTGLGESKPVATNDTAAGRQQNRRVELIVSGESIGTN